MIPALHSLRSPRLFVSRLVFLALDSMQIALGALFMLLLLRVMLRRTWLAVIALLLLNVPLASWNWTPTALLDAIGVGLPSQELFPLGSVLSPRPIYKRAA